MIEEPAKLTIKRPSRRPAAEHLAAFKDAPTGFVVDAMMGAGAMSAEVAPIDLGLGRAKVAGPAVTAGNGPADILATLAALAFIQPGDVLVVATGGHRGCAAAGDRVCGMARNCGAVALVTDGMVRDHAGLVDVGMPVWAVGVTPASPFTTGPGTVGLPVTVAGQRVEAGDMVVADGDGVVVVPFDMVPTVADRLSAVAELEHALDAEVAGGLKVPESIRELLDGGDVTYVE